MGVENNIKMLAFMNALAISVINAGITTQEKLDELARQQEEAFLKVAEELGKVGK